MSYECYCGVQFQLGRSFNRSAAATLKGTVAATSKDSLDDEWFDAIAADEFEAADIRWETNSARAQARVLSRGLNGA